MKLFHRYILGILLLCTTGAAAQINTDQVIRIGRNALYFEDYMLAVQYFNQAIAAKPYLAQPYFLRSVAKLNLEDYSGAEADATQAITNNPFIADAYEVRGVARHNSGNLRGAVQDYNSALELLPRNRHLLFNKALVQTDLEDYDGADSTYSQLLHQYPGMSEAYLGRARLRMLQKDTIAATEDIDHAISLDRNQANAYIMRADIAISSHGDYAAALEDIDQAIRLQPHQAGLYINRAFLRYNLDSYTGAMADYDYALTLDPLNEVALFNRGLLLMEVNANDLALEDFNRVLRLHPDDMRALYNRAIIHKSKGNYSEAIADMERVMEYMPELPAPYYFRGSIRQELGQLAAAESDYRHARQLMAQVHETDIPQETPLTEEEQRERQERRTADAFASLVTIENNAEIESRHNNEAIRGRVQDRSHSIEPEPPMWLTFYTSPNELNAGVSYIREVEDLNGTRALRYVLAVANHIPTLDESASARHFQSIEYYNSYLATHTGRPVDYLGRALDFLTVRDYGNAERDADRIINMAPELALAYIVRAQARYGQYLLEHNQTSAGNTPARNALAAAALQGVLDDLDRAIELSPLMATAWYDKGYVLNLTGDLQGALQAYNKAIELRQDFPEAYFNRGYIELQRGNSTAGIADLSKAGELGVSGAYNLIKRMSR